MNNTKFKENPVLQNLISALYFQIFRRLIKENLFSYQESEWI